jgi:hypothetical protein
MSVGGFGHKIQSSAGVFTAELSALFTALRHIAEVIRPPENFLILTDCLSSIRLCCLENCTSDSPSGLWCMNVNNCAGACARTELR